MVSRRAGAVRDVVLKTQSPQSEKTIPLTTTEKSATNSAPPVSTGRTITAAPQPRLGKLYSVLTVHLLPIAAYALLTILLTWPVAARLSTEVPGGGDAWQNIWNLWWVKDALLNLHSNPYHTNLLFYPDGVNLYFHTLVLTADLTGIPLQLLGLNLIATYNLVLLSSFVLAGYGTYLLCYYLTKSRWAAFVGGLVFAFAPYHFAHMFGHMNLVSLQWMPFYVLLLLKAIDARGRRTTDDRPQTTDGARLHAGTQSSVVRRRLPLPPGLLAAVGAGVLLAVNVYTELTYALFLALLTVTILAWKVLVPAERRAFARGRVSWLEAASRLALFSLTFLILTAPVLLPTLNEVGKGYAEQPAEETLFYSSDLVSAFLPNELNPIWGSAIKANEDAMPPYLPLKNPSERDVFLGYSVLALAAIGFWRLRRNRQVQMWAFIALLMWVFSLGPILQVAGKTQFTLFKTTVPLPYLILFKLPLFNIMRTPGRLTVLVMLALAVLVSFALVSLLPALAGVRSSLTTRARNAQFGAAVVIPVVILFEFFSAPYPTVPPGWNVPIYAQIAQEPGNFALLELPLRPFSDYMAYQTIHGKPIIGGYLSRQPPYPLEEQNATIKYLLDSTPSNDPLQTEVAGGKGVQSLRELGVKYVIIHWWAFTPDQKAAMQAKLNAILNRPPDFSYSGDQVDAWKLSP